MPVARFTPDPETGALTLLSRPAACAACFELREHEAQKLLGMLSQETRLLASVSGDLLPGVLGALALAGMSDEDVSIVIEVCSRAGGILGTARRLRFVERAVASAVNKNALTISCVATRLGDDASMVVVVDFGGIVRACEGRGAIVAGVRPERTIGAHVERLADHIASPVLLGAVLGARSDRVQFFSGGGWVHEVHATGVGVLVMSMRDIAKKQANPIVH